MKRNDFLQNLLLIILSAALAAGIVHLACLGAIPVTFTSRAEVQLIGDDLHVSDVREFARYIEGDASLRKKVLNESYRDDPAGGRGAAYNAETKVWTETGIIDIYVRSGDPYVAHDIAAAIVTAANADYPAAHEGISVKLVEAASVANEPDPLPVFRYTVLGAILGAVFGAFISYAAVKSEREKRRRVRTSDPRFARIEEEDEQVYDALFSDDNEDVDPEMRELYQVAKKAGSAHEKSGREEDGNEGRMSEEAEAAYREAMEIEAAAAGEVDRMNQETDPDIDAETESKAETETEKVTETEGGDPYEE